ncbi:hypothetical protein [Sphingobacterium siyangense]|uniref:hypothetical protein n=1 Tax=Sphingobacterium siyangense TaxID=459529 RepID=UPI00196488A6|nr:hypothetical protein [Sphingobacterium siyangense]QRY55855.1 hypothetical protein JVX97_17700 [Sphingobacterium siyangense]
MRRDQDLYNKYDQLLPSKFRGGYLIIALDEKIKHGELDEYFTLNDIELILREISFEFEQESVRQWSQIKDDLLNYLIANHPEEPGKYYLTEYAKGVLDLMRNKLENPYKNQPLKENFEKCFSILPQEILDINDLERKFGRLFIAGPKKIIIDHLEGLEDELKDAYRMLNGLLDNEGQEAVEMVRAFALTFRKFGERAQDITDAMRSKDRFLKDLGDVVDFFYREMDGARILEDIDQKKKLNENWERSRAIYADIEIFFNAVERKINGARRQIFNASEKLSELQEYFSSRSNYRLRVQKLLSYLLETSSFTEDEITVDTDFPLKSLVYEQPRMFHQKHYEFIDREPNRVIFVLPDPIYERQEREKINKEVSRQQVINMWVEKLKEQLAHEKDISLEKEMRRIIADQGDFSVAYGVAAELVALASTEQGINIDIHQQLTEIQKENLTTWITRITM